MSLVINFHLQVPGNKSSNLVISTVPTGGLALLCYLYVIRYHQASYWPNSGSVCMPMQGGGGGGGGGLEGGERGGDLKCYWCFQLQIFGYKGLSAQSTPILIVYQILILIKAPLVEVTFNTLHLGLEIQGPHKFAIQPTVEGSNCEHEFIANYYEMF